MVKILVVDDQQLVRQGLVSLLSLEEDFEIVGQAQDGSEALLLVEQLSPDVVLMDIRMPVTDGIVATRNIRAAHEHVKILVLTTFDDDELIVSAMQEGASGYLLKDSPTERLSAAIRGVASGYTQLGPTIAPKMVAMMGSRSRKSLKVETQLTERELAVLKAIAEGKSNKEIAGELYLTEGTVKNHVTRILSQLGLRDRTQAALWVKENLE